jgi:hypothetical protein
LLSIELPDASILDLDWPCDAALFRGASEREFPSGLAILRLLQYFAGFADGPKVSELLSLLLFPSGTGDNRASSFSPLLSSPLINQRGTLQYWEEHISTYFVDGGILCLDLISAAKPSKYFGLSQSF